MLGNKHRGFTLIELLVVISILGILAAVVLFSGAGARQSAAITAEQATLEQLNLAMKLYRETTGQYPPSANICSLCSLRSGDFGQAQSRWRSVVDALAPAYMSNSIIEDAWGNPYAYDNNYKFPSLNYYTILCSMGPDGQIQTFTSVNVDDYLLTVLEPQAKGDDLCIFAI